MTGDLVLARKRISPTTRGWHRLLEGGQYRFLRLRYPMEDRIVTGDLVLAREIISPTTRGWHRPLEGGQYRFLRLRHPMGDEFAPLA